MDYEQCPESVKAALPGLLHIPGRGRGSKAADTAAMQIWNGLTRAEKLGYLAVLHAQLVRDLGEVGAAMGRVSGHE